MVGEHYDWNGAFYIEGLKYNPSKWINRETNIEINVYT